MTRKAASSFHSQGAKRSTRIPGIQKDLGPVSPEGLGPLRVHDGRVSPQGGRVPVHPPAHGTRPRLVKCEFARPGPRTLLSRPIVCFWKSINNSKHILLLLSYFNRLRTYRLFRNLLELGCCSKNVSQLVLRITPERSRDPG